MTYSWLIQKLVTRTETRSDSAELSDAVVIVHWKRIGVNGDGDSATINGYTTLSTGEVAVVISENKTRRLRPNILIVLNQDKKPVANSVILNLSAVSANKEETPTEIVKSLEPGAYGINPEELYF